MVGTQFGYPGRQYFTSFVNTAFENRYILIVNNGDFIFAKTTFSSHSLSSPFRKAKALPYSNLAFWLL
jgi:hypothetical protein